MTTFALPLALEAIRFGVKIALNPKAFKENLLKKKAELIKTLTQQEGETSKEFKIRLIKKIAYIALGILLVSAAGALAYYLAPASFSIAAALIAIQLTAKVYKNLNEVPKLLQKCKNYVLDIFTQREGETAQDFKMRRLKSIVITSLIIAVSAATIGGLGVAGYLLMGAKSVWELTNVLPFQTQIVVFLEYAALSLAHTGIAISAFIKGEKAKGLFHTASAIAALAFPIYYILEGKEVRLHHSFIGLALQLVPNRGVQCLGTVITADSFLNSYLGAQGLIRGEVVNTSQGAIVHQYDYQNALLENFPFAVKALASMGLVEAGSDSLV